MVRSIDMTFDDAHIQILEGGKVKDMINLDYALDETTTSKVEDLIECDKKLLIEKLFSDNKNSLRHISDLQRIVEGQRTQIEVLKSRKEI